jgi:hypothetical protein
MKLCADSAGSWLKSLLNLCQACLLKKSKRGVAFFSQKALMYAGLGITLALMHIHATLSGAEVNYIHAIVIGFAAMAANASANEIMLDRCSEEVSISPTYGSNPGANGAILLRRTEGVDWTGWSEPFTVKLGGSGHVRWWCHSTKGNWALSGIHKVSQATCSALGAKLRSAGEEVSGVCKKVGDRWLPNPDTAEGWTAERSRCSNRSNFLRARLGPDRKLQIECLGKAK